jgi:hypothetical protein
MTKPITPTERCVRRCRSASFNYSYGFPRCTHKGTVTRDGKLYCSTHDPVKVAEREKQRHAEYERKSAQRFAFYEREKRRNKALADAADLITELARDGYGPRLQARARAIADVLNG